MRRLLALAALVTMAVAPPALLATLGHTDWTSIHLWGGSDVRVLLLALTALGWLAWAAWMVAFLVELVVAVSGRRLRPTLPGLGAPRALASALIGAVLVAGMSSAAHAEQTSPRPLVAEAAAEGELVAATASEAPAPSRLVHRVQVGDDLWSLAEHYYGDGAQWRQVVEANPALRNDPFTDLPPGMELTIPTPVSLVTVKAGGHPHPAGRRAPRRPGPLARDPRPEPRAHLRSRPDPRRVGPQGAAGRASYRAAVPRAGVLGAGVARAGRPRARPPARPPRAGPLRARHSRRRRHARLRCPPGGPAGPGVGRPERRGRGDRARRWNVSAHGVRGARRHRAPAACPGPGAAAGTPLRPARRRLGPLRGRPRPRSRRGARAGQGPPARPGDAPAVGPLVGRAAARADAADGGAGPRRPRVRVRDRPGLRAARLRVPRQPAVGVVGGAARRGGGGPPGRLPGAGHLGRGRGGAPADDRRDGRRGPRRPSRRGKRRRRGAVGHARGVVVLAVGPRARPSRGHPRPRLRGGCERGPGGLRARRGSRPGRRRAAAPPTLGVHPRARLGRRAPRPRPRRRVVPPGRALRGGPGRLPASPPHLGARRQPLRSRRDRRRRHGRRRRLDALHRSGGRAPRRHRGRPRHPPDRPRRDPPSAHRTVRGGLTHHDPAGFLVGGPPNGG